MKTCYTPYTKTAKETLKGTNLLTHEVDTSICSGIRTKKPQYGHEKLAIITFDYHY